ncbi:hypothetical protein MDA_GLEAN10020431 [Myotis davidii]|uniref:Uncharacterized protein n=1 Tax=Myotis davidii TaxID=225400 RepID=L5MA17_MYODS|nr:hypothetical protein MDA_GLEAN10020431 [Myotis davidii]
MARVSDTALQRVAVEVLLGPDGPRRERDWSGMVEHVSGQHQAKVGVSKGLIDLQTVTSGGSGGLALNDHPTGKDDVFLLEELPLEMLLS